MFTGIVQQLATVRGINGKDPLRLEIELAQEIPGLALGESLSLDGVCLTVTAAHGRRVSFDVSHESVQRTTLGDARLGSRINVERALTASSLLGGHLVQGHVDGVGVVRDHRPVQGSLHVEISAPAELFRYMVPLGSIAVNGVSLTITELLDGSESRGTTSGSDPAFAVNLVPHTVAVTTLGRLGSGSRVNLEVDVVAKYLERLAGPYASRPGITEELLRRGGYV